jgi:hypothetical protein
MPFLLEWAAGRPITRPEQATSVARCASDDSARFGRVFGAHVPAHPAPRSEATEKAAGFNRRSMALDRAKPFWSRPFSFSPLVVRGERDRDVQQTMPCMPRRTAEGLPDISKRRLGLLRPLDDLPTMRAPVSEWLHCFFSSRLNWRERRD